MCGICGIYYFDSERNVDESLVRNMLFTIEHRGPDEEGMFLKKNVALGIRRLKIIDLDTGTQPITDSTGNYTIVLNGEIYNYLNLRAELENFGYSFRTRSDTEVILYAYIRWGLDFVSKLNGMFAIAIWDEQRRTLLLVRDRIGIKPLFFYNDEERFVFSSEIKTILTDKKIKREINIKALYYHFLLNYIPDNKTLFKDIHHLPPGHLMTIKDGNIYIKKYWELCPEIEEKGKRIEDYKDEFISLFQDAVRLRLRSDVPLGVFLSGGLDSSSVAAMAAGVSDYPIRTFSVGFEEESFDESPYSEIVAQHLETEHHNIVVKGDILNILPKIVEHMEEPTADSSAIPVYYLSEFTRRYVTVALSGDGADELAAGYETYTADYLANYLSFIPKKLVQSVHRIVGLFPASFEKYAYRQKLERFLRGLQYDPPVAHLTWRNIWDYGRLSSLFSETLYDERILYEILDNFRDTFNLYGKADLLTGALYADTVHYLPNDMLIKVDRMSMAHSLEVRVPFLDHRLVEFFFRLPARFKLKNWLVKKYLIKEAMKNRLPEKIISRKKSGFTVPIGKWFLTSLRELTGDLINSKMVKTTGILNQDYLLKIYEEHQQKRFNHDYMLWSVLIFLLWYQRFINQEDVN